MKLELFETLLQLNIAASVAILVVLALRILCREYLGVHAAYRLWIVVVVALIAVLLPARQIYVAPLTPISIADETQAAAIADHSGLVAEQILPSKSQPDIARARGLQIIPAPGFSDLAIAFWLAGVALAAALTWRRQNHYLKSIGSLTREKINGATIWRSDKPGIGPALVGAFRLRIILPSDFEKRYKENERALILEHEKIHAETGDTRVNFVVSALQCLFWFNPLIHMAARRLREDQEIACDAVVVSRHPKSKRLYGEVLLKSVTAQGFIPAGCSWSAKTKSGISERLSSLVTAPSRKHARIQGAIVVGITCVFIGSAVWAAQPPRRVDRPVLASVATPQLSLAANASRSTYDVTAVDLKNIAATLRVITEDRSDIAVSIGQSAKLPAPAMRIKDGRLMIDGQLEFLCGEHYDGSAPVTLPGAGEVQRSDLLEIVIRTPRVIDLSVKGFVLTEVSHSSGGRIDNDSCGDMQIAQADGSLDLGLFSYGDVTVDQLDAGFTARLFGLGDMHLEGGKAADIDLRGQGDIIAGRFSETVKARLLGIGNIEFTSIGGGAELTLPGDGDVLVGEITGSVFAEIAGSGGVRIENGSIDELRTILSGAGGVYFGGSANVVDAEFENTAANVFVAQAGDVKTRRKGSSIGTVTVGR